MGVIKQRLIQVDSPANLRRSLYGRRVVVQLVSVSDPVRAAVRGLPFVKDVQEDANSLVVSLEDPETHNPVLVERIVAAGGAVQFVRELHHSLEDIYFTLLEEEGQGGIRPEQKRQS